MQLTYSFQRRSIVGRRVALLWVNRAGVILLAQVLLLARLPQYLRFMKVGLHYIIRSIVIIPRLMALGSLCGSCRF